ncbi:hypothetical protein [Absidia glauca]|uniref:Integrase catalytic domain-containing protein n=1 Tax=Absidia glauca TaxID=4829 RepID=A0A168LB45_ABSGL|nr:hypothetical protein [Absidia glauca]
MISRYVELYPLATPSQGFLATIIYQHFVPRHGLFDEFLSDNGPPFTAEFITTLATLLQTNLRFSPPYHQQANGMAERFMGTLRRLIITFIEQDTMGIHWDRRLTFLAFAHNTSHLDILNSTPYFICHGQHARIPLFSAPHATPTDGWSAPLDYIKDITATLELAYAIVIDSFRAYNESLLSTGLPN